MMKRMIIGFLALLFSVWIGVTICRNPGYVLVSYQDWTIETSLWFAIAALIMIFIVFYILLRLGSGISSIATYFKQWVSGIRKRAARARTISGLYDFVEGNWRVAEKKLIRAAKYSDMPLINYLAAAFMAQQQDALLRRDDYLQLAQQFNAEHPIGVGLTQVRLQILDKQWEEALAILQRLHRLQPKNVLILQLLELAYFELKDWSGLKNLLPILRKRRAFSVEEIDQLEVKVCSEILLASKANNTIQIRWSELSSYLKKQPALVAIYTEYLLVNNQTEEAESILKMVLHRKLDNRLLELYAALPSTNPIRKIARTEKWLEKNLENSALLLCLGRICRQQKLWGKARQYLEQSLRLMPTPAVYLELGQMMEEQHDLHGALDFYKRIPAVIYCSNR